MPAHLTPEQFEVALDLQAKCWTQRRIASHLGVDQSTVSRSLSKHNRRVLERLLARSAAVKARQVSQLEWMADEAAQAWERSKLDAETVRTIVRTTEEGPKVAGDTSGATVLETQTETKTETTIKGQTGSPAYLTEARAALADIREILGLDAAHELAAEKLALQTKDDDTPSVRDALGEAESRDEAFGESDEPEGQGDADPEAPADPAAPGPVQE